MFCFYIAESYCEGVGGMIPSVNPRIIQFGNPHNMSGYGCS